MGASYRGSKSPSGPRVVPHVSHAGAPGGYYSSGYGQNLVVSLPPSYSTGGSSRGSRTVTVTTGSSGGGRPGTSAYQHGGSANRTAYSGQRRALRAANCMCFYSFFCPLMSLYVMKSRVSGNKQK